MFFNFVLHIVHEIYDGFPELQVHVRTLTSDATYIYVLFAALYTTDIITEEQTRLHCNELPKQQ